MKDPHRLYEARYAYPIRLMDESSVPRDLGLIVTIPCYHETGLLSTLESLKTCDQPACQVEVLVLINYPAEVGNSVREQNRQTFRNTEAWIRENSTPEKSFHVLCAGDLPSRQAGVGLARKIVMDEAARRLVRSGHPQGIITGFDADCRCDSNYLTAVFDQFRHDNLSGASVFFEHTSADTEAEAAGITGYELHLRYYIDALRLAGFPYAFHTVGSCMAVRADIYHRQGGMNTRKAGEDFYFLHKIIPLGYFGEINNTTVRPSPRVSERVPFGTGRAMLEWSRGFRKEYETYHPGVFEELARLFEKLDNLFGPDPADPAEFAASLPTCIRRFLDHRKFRVQVLDIRKKAVSIETRKERFYNWFNALTVLRFVHHAVKEKYGMVPVSDAAARLNEKLAAGVDRNDDVSRILMKIRKYDRVHPLIYYR